MALVNELCCTLEMSMRASSLGSLNPLLLKEHREARAG